MQASRNPRIAIVGAGPYGLSIAAHLSAAGLDFRVFGEPMHRWRCQMPQGMYLKSEGCASSLSDPSRVHTLARYCDQNRLPYGDWGKPVALTTLVDYALDFQRRLVPSVEHTRVASIDFKGNDKRAGLFEIRLADDTAFHARSVVISTGLEYLEHVPDPLAALPRELASHSSRHHDLNRFAGKQVAVVGAGQSAIELAALLAEQRASVHLVVRKPDLVWNPPPKHVRRSAYQRLRHPATGLGVGVELWAYCRAPHLFHYLPRNLRAEKITTVLGPAGAHRLKEQIAGRVRVLTSHVVENARVRSGRAALQLVRPDSSRSELIADHVIAATGYRFALHRLPFLSGALKSAIRLDGAMPALSSCFESSVPGLYFTGLSSAMSFGPVMRFLYGADFTAQRIAFHLRARERERTPFFSPLFAPSSKCDV